MMLHIVLLVGLVMVGGYGGVLVVGQQATLPALPAESRRLAESFWARVLQERPVQQHYRNSTVTLRRHGRPADHESDSCLAEAGGFVHRLGQDDEGVLVVYRAEGAPMGTPCPTGVEFLLSHAAWEQLDAQWAQREQEEARLAQRVRQMRTP